MNLRHLEVFCTVVQCESFSGAADMLIMTQPAVSMQVQVVERYFGGVPLLVRKGRRVVLTEAGEVVHRWASHVLATEVETQRTVNDLKHAESGRVVVGSSISVGSYLLPPIVSRFKREHPGAEIVVRLGERGEVFSEILSGETDCGVVLARDVPMSLEVEFVGAEEMLFICANSHPMADRDYVSPEEIARQPFIMSPRGSSYRKVMDDMLHEHGVEHVSVFMELDGIDGLKRGVLQGEGIGMLLRSVIEWELEQGLVHELRVVDPRPTIEVAIVSRPRGQTSPMLQELMQFLRQELREHYLQHDRARIANSPPVKAKSNGKELAVANGHTKNIVAPNGRYKSSSATNGHGKKVVVAAPLTPFVAPPTALHPELLSQPPLSP
ncbi:MAG: hypothetical protein QOF51_3083 [Chloroflexota bacterium]|nr:hypothetical protein [Chloroflexota bacterium]